jgi:hypothetical protein
VRIDLGSRTWSRRALGLRYCVAAVAAGLTATGCGPAFHSSHRVMKVPADAFAAAPLGGAHVAVLTGGGGVNKVFIVDISTGNVLKNFSVSGHSTGIVAQSPDGPLWISVRLDGPGKHARGAVESWTLDGEKKQEINLPASPLALTKSIDGIQYVLLADGRSRVAAPIEGQRVRFGAAIPLEGDAHSLQQCKIGDRYYFVYTTGSPDAPTCVGGRMRVYAISHGFMGHHIKALQVPDLRELRKHRLAPSPFMSRATSWFRSTSGEGSRRSKRSQTTASTDSKRSRTTSLNA